MSILTIASTKGGVGKSTFLINLAVYMQSQGKKIAILDGDKQNTVNKWNKVREFMRNNGEISLSDIFVASAIGQSLIDLAMSYKNQGYYVLIDAPGVDDPNMRSSLVKSDYILTPCPPSSVDLWEIESMSKIVKQLCIIQHKKLPLISLFNRVPAIHTNNALEDANNFLINNNILPDYILKSSIKDRIVFKHAIREGKGVIEYTPHDSKACKEIKDCYEEIIDIIKQKNSIVV